MLKKLFPFFLIIFFIFIVLIKKETHCYIGYTTDLTDSMLNAEIYVDNQKIYVGSIQNSHIHRMDMAISLKMRIGYHSIKTILPRENNVQEITFFYAFQNYIIIDFIPKEEREKGKDFFFIIQSYTNPIE